MKAQLVVAAILGLAALVNSQNSCITPNGETGQCISVYQCKVIIDALANRTSDTVRFLRASRCGYYEDPLVCCGSVATYQQVSTDAPPVTPTQPTGPTKPAPEHDNVKLLPTRKVCGVQLALDRIFMGNETGIDAFPWMALLEYRKNGRSQGHSCGGMLINDRYVLTAAHCYVGDIEREVGTLYRIRLGEYNTSSERDCENRGGFEDCADPYQDVEVENVIAHNNYLRNPNKFDDIALVRLTRPVKYSDFIKPICLPLNGERSNTGENLTVAGWGYTEKNVFSDVKLKVQLAVMDRSRCANIFRSQFNVDVTEKQLCAGGVGQRDSCSGDSGGPLMRRFPGQNEWYAEGIVSYGTACGTEGVPGVYTRISEYLGWILDNMKS